MKTVINILIALVVLVSSANCDEIKIAISRGSGSDSYDRYGKWLSEIDSSVVSIDLYYLPLDSALLHLSNSHGLMLSGGPDVHPIRYGQGHDTARCQIDLWRDTLEFALIDAALEMNLPIFAICRGEQILNVALGGSLIVDIPDDFPSNINHSCEDRFALCHDVIIVDGTFLKALSNIDFGKVTSTHHQAVDRLADGLRANAFSMDGLIEGFEWADRSNRPFMMAVQWHPERMPKSPLAHNIACEFIKAAKIYMNLHKSAKE